MATLESSASLSLFAAPSSSSSAPAPSPNPLAPHVPQHTLQYLDRLHAESLAQEGAIDPAEVARVGFDAFMQDKYIALDQGKCWFVYQMCLAIGASNIVEVSSILSVIQTDQLALCPAWDPAVLLWIVGMADWGRQGRLWG